MTKVGRKSIVSFLFAFGIMMSLTFAVPPTAEQVKVPRVVGDWEVNARSTIELAGLTVSGVNYTQTMSPNLHNIVEWQQPTPGKEVEKGSGVAIKVFKYDEDRTKIVRLPNVVGLDAVRAKNLLQRDKLVVAVTTIPGKNPNDKGKVNKQNPPAGTEVGQGAKIALEVFN